MLITPVRGSPVGFAATVKFTVPLPAPSTGNEKVIHEFVFTTFHAQSALP